MKIIFNGREKGNVVLPLIILLFMAVSLGWVVLTYIGKSPTPPEGIIATSTVPVVETKKEEQEISLLPQPAAITSPEAAKAKIATEATVKKSGASASITLTSAKNNYTVGEEVLVSVNLSTNADTAGADVYLEYDQSLLELIKSDSSAGGVVGKNVAALYFAENTKSVFGDIPNARLVEINGKKVLAFSSLSKAQQSFKGSGVITTLRFKTLAVGSATIKILATPGQTNDTNVALMGKGVDILKETKDITLTIR